MLALKSLLRQHGISVPLTSLDAYTQLLEASASIDHPEVRYLRERLIESETSSPSPVSHPHPEPGDASALLSERDSDRETAAPIRKAIYPHGPHEGLLHCDHCQHETIVKVDREEPIQPLCVQCPCGTSYQVVTEVRRYLRIATQLPGAYIGIDHEAQAGEMTVENVSFGGLRMRVASPHRIGVNDCLYVHFILDDERQTFVWELVCVRYVQGYVIGAEFADGDPDHALDAFLQFGQANKAEPRQDLGV